MKLINKSPLFVKVLVFAFLINVVFVLSYRSFSQPEGSNLSKGENIFKANCAGCHLSGQNLIKPDKPVIASPKLKSKEIFAVFIESPPPPMPKFKNITEKQAQLDALYKYVTSLKGK